MWQNKEECQANAIHRDVGRLAFFVRIYRFVAKKNTGVVLRSASASQHLLNKHYKNRHKCNHIRNHWCPRTQFKFRPFLDFVHGAKHPGPNVVTKTIQTSFTQCSMVGKYPFLMFRQSSKRSLTSNIRIRSSSKEKTD